MKRAGIYLITCKPNDGLPRYYVGQTCNFNSRKGSHLSKLRNRKHVNRRLQFAWDKYGESTFSFELLEECSVRDLDVCETWWLDQMCGHRRVLNISSDAYAVMRGKKFSEEHKRKIGMANSGDRHYLRQRGMTEEHRSKVGSKKGVKKSPETRAKMTAALLKRFAENPQPRGSDSPMAKPVTAVSKKTGEVLIFGSLVEAKDSGFDPTKISLCCNGKRKSHSGYRWEFV